MLEHLVDVRCEDLGSVGAARDDDAASAAAATKEEENAEEREYGFRLSFVFEVPNPFFDSPADGVITKTYHMAAEDEEGMLERAVGTRIAWKAGKDPTVKILKKKPGRGGRPAPSGKPMTKIEKTESFFNFFSPPAVPEEGDDDLDEEAEALQEALEEDYELGETLRDELIPHAVSFYTGEMAEMDEEEEEEDEYEETDGDDDDDDDDDGDDDDDDDSEEEEEEDRHAPSGKQARGGGGGGKRSGGKGGSGGAKGGEPQDTGEKPAECKQQ